MQNFWLIYRNELAKIGKRRITIVSLIIMGIITLFLNLSSIPLYSVGRLGAYIHSPGASLLRVPLRYVDQEGNLIEENISALAFIRRQREFALKWKGAALNNDVIAAMQDFYRQYGYDDDPNTYSDAYLLQNYYWVFRSIWNLGLNPYFENLSEESIKACINEEWLQEYEQQQLSEKERDFWSEHKVLNYPLIMDYAPAYQQLIGFTRWIHLMLLLFVIVALSESYSLEKRRNTRRVMQATPKGFSAALFARFLAGLTIAVSSSILLYGSSMLIQFAIFGADGFSMPLQQLEGFVWSRLMLSSGNAMLLLMGSSILIVVATAACTMILSEITQNAVVPIGILSGALLLTQVFEIPYHYRNRQLSQLWSYFPIQRIGAELLYDERLVPVGSHFVRAIPFSTAIYFGVAFLAFALCMCHAAASRRDRA